MDAATVWLEVTRPLFAHPRRPRWPLVNGKPVAGRVLQPGEIIQVTEEDRKMWYQFHTRHAPGPQTRFPQPEVAVALAPLQGPVLDELETTTPPPPPPVDKDGDGDPVPVFKPAPKPRKK